MISSERCVAMSAANHDSNWAKHKFKLLRARRVDQDRREQEQRRSASARARKGGCLAHDAAAPEGGEHVRAAVAVQHRAPSTETKTARAASAHARLQRPLAAAEAAAAAAAEASSLPDTPRASALETHVATPATSERCIPTWSSLTPEAAASVQSSSAGGRASSTSASSSASSPCSSLSAEGSSVQGQRTAGSSGSGASQPRSIIGTSGKSRSSSTESSALDDAHQAGLLLQSEVQVAQAERRGNTLASAPPVKARGACHSNSSARDALKDVAKFLARKSVRGIHVHGYATLSPAACSATATHAARQKCTARQRRCQSINALLAFMQVERSP